MTPGKANAVIPMSNELVQPSGTTSHTTMDGNFTNNTDMDVRLEASEALSNEMLEAKPTSTDTNVSHKVAPKIEPTEEGELLGSLVKMNSPAVRTSARVIQKMKQDSIRPTTPPLAEKKEFPRDDRGAQKTPNHTRASKTIWSNIERNLFFEALNEYGKDFEAIASYINVKQKRKNATDPTYKAKENVRQLYYQSYHKVSKYLRFSDDIKKNVQELYALINYGEMRKRVTFPNQKCFMKLRELVYRGWVSLRWKGKTYRIKTPSCKALRKINQVEEWQEDIKLPLKVDVILRAANSESWCRVQSIAQNPRIKITLPLQKRLISIFKTIQSKWRSRDAKLIDQATVLIQQLHQRPGGGAATTTTATTTTTSNASAQDRNVATPESSTGSTVPSLATNAQSISTSTQPALFPHTEPTFYIMPQNDAIIHRPMVNLTEFLSSQSICLNSYEERIGVTTRGETLCAAERMNAFKEIVRTNAKRQRHDSGSEKKSPDMKRTRAESDSEKCDIIVNARLRTSSRDQSNLKTVDDQSSTTDEEKFDGDFMTGTNSAMDDMQVVDSASADEYEREDTIKTEIKSEAGDETDKKETIDLLAEPTLVVPDCIKQNLAKKSRKEAKSALAAKKKLDVRRETFRPLINEEVLREIRKGWTVDTVGDLTIGDLYLMFGQDSKVYLEYKWEGTFGEIDNRIDPTRNTEPVASNKRPVCGDNGHSDMNGFDRNADQSCKPKNPLNNKLKQLLMLASMTEKTKRKVSCACSHFGDRGANKLKKEDGFPRSFISNKIYPTSHTDNGLFRQPVIPLRSGLSPMEAYRLQMNTSRSKQNRWVKMRNNRPSKHVVVQRMLPLQPGMTQIYGVVDTSEYKVPEKATSSTFVNHTNNFDDTDSPSRTSSASNKSLLTSENLNRINSRQYFDNNNGSSSASTSGKSTDSIVDNGNHENDTDNNDDQTNDDDDELDDELNNEQLSDNDAEPDPEPDRDDLDDVSKRLNEDPGIQSLMDISLPSPFPVHAHNDEYFGYGNGTPPMSPMGILQDHPTDPRWYEENLNDFSLSSFLGHLDASCELNGKSTRSTNCNMDSSSLSTISDTSIDYITKFEELAESMKNESSNLLMQ